MTQEILRNIKNWPPSFSGSYSGSDRLYTGDTNNVVFNSFRHEDGRIVLDTTYRPSSNNMSGIFESPNPKVLEQVSKILEKNIGKTIDEISGNPIEIGD